jgi:hypothetical protein
MSHATDYVVVFQLQSEKPSAPARIRTTNLLHWRPGQGYQGDKGQGYQGFNLGISNYGPGSATRMQVGINVEFFILQYIFRSAPD